MFSNSPKLMSCKRLYKL